METEYTVAEFRVKMKEAFETAVAHTVTINRNGMKYQLLPYTPDMEEFDAEQASTQDKLDRIIELLEGSEKKESSKPLGSSEVKPAGVQPVRTKFTVQGELWAVEKRLNNIVNEVQDKAVEESWTDEESVSYAHQLETELNQQRDALAQELSTLV